MKKILFTIFFVSLFNLFGQITGRYNHPDLKWKTFETKHFVFIYHEGTEYSANRFANVAEHSYKPITDLYNYRPEKKMRVIINDYEDYANGGAYYYNNKISLWAPNLDTELRGTHNWFRNVFTHEFSHMIELNAPKKAGNFIPGIYIQGTGYEKEKRKDVLTGFPNVLASYSIPMHIIPGWFAEGVAQNQAMDTLFYDFWDSNRDMVMRERILTDQAFSFDKLSDFGNKTSHEAETVYNTGMGFVKYMANMYGKTAIDSISREMGKFTSFFIENAIERVTGTNGRDLYKNFLSHKKSEYGNNLKTINANLVEGINYSDSAFVNSNPQFSPDGTKLAYLSTKDNGEVTFYRRSLYVKDLKTDSVKLIAPSILFSSYCWDNDSKGFYYSQIESRSIYGEQYQDIYYYNIEEDKQEQVTYNKRAINPAISPDGKLLAYAASHDGTQNLYVYDLETGEEKNLTNKNDGTQYYLPRWSKDNQRILIGNSDKYYGRNISIIDTKGNVLKKITSRYDMKAPCFSDEEKDIYYASDKTGIFNIYRYNLSSDKEDLITNVRGGAFYPEVKGNELIYSNYKGIKFNLYKISKIKALDKKTAKYNNYQIPKFYDDIKSIEYTKSAINYKIDYEHIFLLPRISFDNGDFKPGFYFFMNDYLNKISLCGGAAVNPSNKDYDIFISSEFKILLPTIHASYINVVKHSENSFTDSTKIVGVGEGVNGEEIPIFKTNNIAYTYDIKDFTGGFKFAVPYALSILEFPLGNVDLDFFYEQQMNSAKADYGNFVLSYDYFKDKSFHFKANLSQNAHGLNSDINPQGKRDLTVEYSRHNAKLIDGFELDSDYGTLQEKYISSTYNQYSLDWKEYFKIYKEISIYSKIKASYLDKDTINSFYNDYIGGLTGLKGYSFYSIGGTRTLLSSLNLRFPLIDRINKTIGFFNFKKLHAGFFMDNGIAWTGKENLLDTFNNNLKTDIGISLRLFGVSFNNYPTSLEYSIAYGLNEFVDNDVTYGHEIRIYLTLLFGFQDF